MRKFIAKPNTFFKEGTEARLVEYIDLHGDKKQYGIFEGITFIGDKKSEVCCYDDFEIHTNEWTRDILLLNSED